jgi:hypothetical protein
MNDGTMTPEEQLQTELAAIVGADPEKLASARGAELGSRQALDADVQDVFPGFQKVASLSSMSLDQIMEDPNFKAGVNHELEKTADEWVPIARRLLGLE